MSRCGLAELEDGQCSTLIPRVLYDRVTLDVSLISASRRVTINPEKLIGNDENGWLHTGRFLIPRYRTVGVVTLWEGGDHGSGESLLNTDPKSLIGV